MESAGKKNSNGGKINWEEAQDCSFVLDVQWCHQKHWEDPQVLLQPGRRLQGWNTKQIFCTPFFCWMSVNNCRTLSVLALITFSVLQREILSVLNAGFRQVYIQGYLGINQIYCSKFKLSKNVLLIHLSTQVTYYQNLTYRKVFNKFVQYLYHLVFRAIASMLRCPRDETRTVISNYLSTKFYTQIDQVSKKIFDQRHLRKIKIQLK